MVARTTGLYLRLAPALGVTVIMLGASLAYGVAQSLGYIGAIGARAPSLDAYAKVFGGQGVAGREFWVSFGFSLWVSLASTVLAAAGALGIAAWLADRPVRMSGFALHWNLALPHLVWAVGLVLVLGQSGLVARWAAALGWITRPAEFPVLVRDRFGLGIILHYVSKEIPFLTLIVLAVLRTQAPGLLHVAANLGAGRWQRFRWVILPLVLPALIAGALLVFAYCMGAYEAPALLGVRYPRALPVLALDLFTNPDLRARAEGMVIGLFIAAATLLAAGLARRGQALA